MLFIVLIRFSPPKINSPQNNFSHNEISFEEIDSSELLTNEERTRLYAELFKAADISEIRSAIRDWLQKLDEQRANLQQDDFLESL